MFGTFDNDSALQRKGSIRFKPAMVYGHSQESPSHMKNRYTIYYESQQKKIAEAPSKIKIHPVTKQGFNISKQFERQNSERIKNKVQSNNTHFNLTRGTFSTFMDNHKHYSNISVLYKDPLISKLQNTQIKPHKSIPSNQTQTSHNYQTTKSITNQRSVADSKNTRFSLRSSSLGLLKTSIRQRRQQFIQNNSKQIEADKKRNMSNFELGRGQNRHLLFWGKQKVKQIVGKSETQEIGHELELFQKKLYRKFK